MYLSKHFDSSEFECHCCGGLPPEGISHALIDGLEELRVLVGRPINVTCGYRCPEHNLEVGGVSNSQHVLGKAADIYVDGVGVYELAKLAATIFDGVGEYYDDEFVHVDMRDDGDSVGYYRWDDQD